MYQDEIVANRIEQERRTVRFMIELYCRKRRETRLCAMIAAVLLNMPINDF